MRMKRGIALLLSIAMCFSVLSGCGNQTGSAVKLESVAENTTESTDKVVLSDAAAIDLNEDVEKYEEYFETSEEDVKVGMNFVTGSSDQETESSDDVISSLIDKNLNDEKKEDTKAELDQPFDLAYPDIFNSDAVEFADNAILLKLKDTYSEKTAEGLKNSGVGKMEVMFEMKDYIWYTAYLLKDVDVTEAMAKVREVPGVKTAEYNFKYETTTEVGEAVEVDLSSNPRYSDQWPVNKIGIQETWNHLQKETGAAGGSSSVVVAVIDTGVDYTHPDLKSNMWVNVNEIPDNNCDDDGNGYVDDYYGVNMTRDSYYEADPGTASGMDDNGHGTHVAGIIAATNNDIGMVGYAYNAKIMAIKAGDASGYFLQNNVAEAILYAYDHGADVINMSFGGSAASIAVQDALAVAYSRCVLVASAGNDGKPNENTLLEFGAPNYPAALSYVIGVMSVDQRMVESTFSNWDVNLYNNVEYEVYAPGEQIISTLPGERYGMLSGTSMAAPIVAAQAALLRSCYSDTNIYPTKFIYGQIVSTADKCVTCLNPEKHLKHNIPGVVNFYNSLTYLPTPDVGMSDYTIFDTAGYVADAEGLTEGCAEVNNGDGIIDAGETIALGFTLRNRWGMSENTTVHIDATSSLGVDNPYVTFLNNDINYKSIGTYSENDCGKLFSEDGEYWNGWENPFYIQIAKNCPNDYSVTLNVTITCENALDPGDDTVYETKESIMFTVRRGQILPNRLSEDMTLTKDNYYIIPNSMIIMEGATLTVEEGTHIQFWCSDPSDSYADTAITYLKVAGKLICKGTEEEPVELFPSGWMDRYRVEIYTADNGKVCMEHTNVTNPYLTITEAKNCTFTQNYKEDLSYRYLSSGQVRTSTTSGRIDIENALESVFYKLGGNWNRAYIYGKYNKCIFVDSAINYQASKMTGCVFYGNNNLWSDGNGQTSSMNLGYTGNTCAVSNIFRNAETGTTYIAISGPADEEVAAHLAKRLGGNLIGFESESELVYVLDKLIGTMSGDSGLYLDAGMTQEGEVYRDYFGNEMPWVTKYMEVYKDDGKFNNLYYPSRNQTPHVSFYVDYDSNQYLMEIPGDIYITDIQLEEYVVDIDLETTYQINAALTPHTADEATLEYVSEDESIVTVDENGVITPVAAGTTNVRIYAPDYAVYNYVTVNVVEAVPLESLAVREGDFTMDINTEKQLHVVYNPTYTTRKNVTYASSNEEVLTVSAKGIVTALKEGESVITVTGENDISCEITVNVIIPVESVLFTEDVYATTLEQEDGTAFYPVITPSDATYQELIWESSNPEVAYVNEEGMLLKLQEGTATLKASLKGTELSDTIVVAVANQNVSVELKSVKYSSNARYALMEDGTLWTWGDGTVKYPRRVPIENVQDFMVNGSTLYILDETRSLTKYDYNWSNNQLSVEESFVPLQGIKALSGQSGNSSSYFAIADDGFVWAWGNNNYGMLGTGNGDDQISIPTLVELEEKVQKVVVTYWTTAFLTENGNVYLAGDSDNQYLTPTLFATDIYGIESSMQSILMEKDTQILQAIGSSPSINTVEKKNETYDRIYHSYYVQDGVLFVCGNMYGFSFGNVKLTGVNNVKKVFDIGDNIYIQTDDGKVYAYGYGAAYVLGTGNLENAKEDATERVYFGLVENDLSLELESINGTYEEGKYYVTDSEIRLDFNAAIEKSNNYSSIVLKTESGAIQPTSKDLELDKLVITPKTDMVDGETYTLTVPNNALIERGGSYNQNITIMFVYHEQLGEDELPETELPDTEIGEDEVEEVIHETVVDTEKMNERHFWTSEEVLEYWNKFVTDGHNTRFHSNVILNRLNDDDVTQWLRFTANEGDGVNYQIGLGGNYWGTTNEDLINKQILDFDDYQSLYDILEGEILTEAPEDTFPFVVDAYLMLDEEVVDTVGNDLVKFVVEFNRDMDTSIPLEVKFGSAYPYADYEVGGEYVTPRQWKGEMQLTTIIENGYQYWSVSNGKAAGTSLKLYTDWGRFPFKIDTSSAQALIMQADVSETGIQLTWTQDDFDTLAGYNVYRSTEEDGLYTRLNRTVIPADTMEWFDDTVEPGQKYYYNFTVVDTDLTESEPSGKVQVTAMDTMAPNIYHSPVYHAFTGSNLVISATVTDNVSISEATLYYRIAGTDTWESKVMTNNNDKYSAVIPASMITVAGVEYYIDATDGISHTLKGSQDAPYSVTVQVAVADSEKGDVDGNGAVELRDALMVLMAINDRLNLTEEQFARADLDGNGSLAAKEALRIMQYVNGSISSIL